MKKLFLLDAYALIFRAYYAFIKNPRVTSSGFNTSAIFGFVNVIEEILRTEQPTHIAIALDHKDGSFRNQEYPAYKAQRDATPEDIIRSVPYIRQILEAMNITMYEIPGYEADDTIGTLAKKAEKLGFTVYMMTPDKDYCQLVSENIFVYKPRKGANQPEVWGIPQVQQAFNVERPEQVIDVLAMWGDVSDNVPGLDGVGEKKSKEFVQTYGSLEGLLKNVELVGGKLKQKILDSKANAIRAKHLIRIVTDMDIEIDEEQLKVREANAEKLTSLFAELEFNTLINKIISRQKPADTTANLFADSKATVADQLGESREMADINTTKHIYCIAETADEIATLLAQLSAQAEFCFDTETTGLDVLTDQLVGMSFAWEAHKAYYVPVPASREAALLLLEQFKPLFENEATRKIGQNIKFDLMMLRQYGISLAGKLFDTMIAHYLLHPDGKHGMDAMAQQCLNYITVPIENVIGAKGKTQITMREAKKEVVAQYAAEDADITLQLKELFEPQLTESGLLSLFDEVEMPLVYVLADMEWQGIRFDKEQMVDLKLRLTADLDSLQEQIYRHAGEEFNINSPKQLGEVLFDRMKIVADAKMTKTKQYATGEAELQKLVSKHPIISLILEYRTNKKLLTTYVETLPLLIHPTTGRIHTSFNQAVAATGRLSSNNPNLQNIPIRTERGREMRKAFVPSDNQHLLMSADYSQIELRLIAHFSKDANMIEAFNQQADIHTATAAKIHGIAETEVTKDMRSHAKSANFGIIYGISSFGLAQNLNISRTEAKQLIDGYFATYPDVKNYMTDSVTVARKQKYTTTILDRRRDLRDIDSSNAIVRGVAERNAINAPIQGSAADIIKMAMIKIAAQLKAKNLQSKMLLQVHDELVFDVPKSEMQVVTDLVKYEMENAVKLLVPLTVEAKHGNNWDEAH